MSGGPPSRPTALQHERNECAICLVDLSVGRGGVTGCLPCGHLFHHRCWRAYSRRPHRQQQQQVDEGAVDGEAGGDEGDGTELCCCVCRQPVHAHGRVRFDFGPDPLDQDDFLQEVLVALEGSDPRQIDEALAAMEGMLLEDRFADRLLRSGAYLSALLGLVKRRHQENVPVIRRFHRVLLRLLGGAAEEDDDDDEEEEEEEEEQEPEEEEEQPTTEAATVGQPSFPVEADSQQFRPTRWREECGYSWMQSISAMPEFQSFSFEELRLKNHERLMSEAKAKLASSVREVGQAASSSGGAMETATLPMVSSSAQGGPAGTGTRLAPIRAGASEDPVVFRMGFATSHGSLSSWRRHAPPRLRLNRSRSLLRSIPSTVPSHDMPVPAGPLKSSPSTVFHFGVASAPLPAFHFGKAPLPLPAPATTPCTVFHFGAAPTPSPSPATAQPAADEPFRFGVVSAATAADAQVRGFHLHRAPIDHKLNRKKEPSGELRTYDRGPGPSGGPTPASKGRSRFEFAMGVPVAEAPSLKQIPQFFMLQKRETNDRLAAPGPGSAPFTPSILSSKASLSVGAGGGASPNAVASFEPRFDCIGDHKKEPSDEHGASHHIPALVDEFEPAPRALFRFGTAHDIRATHLLTPMAFQTNKKDPAASTATGPTEIGTGPATGADSEASTPLSDDAAVKDLEASAEAAKALLMAALERIAVAE